VVSHNLTTASARDASGATELHAAWQSQPLVPTGD
jgi:hypothetical protein